MHVLNNSIFLSGNVLLVSTSLLLASRPIFPQGSLHSSILLCLCLLSWGLKSLLFNIHRKVFWLPDHVKNYYYLQFLRPQDFKKSFQANLFVCKHKLIRREARLGFLSQAWSLLWFTFPHYICKACNDSPACPPLHCACHSLLQVVSI